MGARSVSRIASEMQLHQQANNPLLSGYGRYQVLGGITRSLAVAIHKTEALIYEASANLSIRTATGSALDALVVDRLPEGRLPGARAGGFVIFYRDSPAIEAITIPLGTRLSRSTEGGESEYFETIEAVTLNVGETSVAANIQALDVGTTGNVPAFSISNIYDTVAGIDYVENPQQTSGGEDPEDDTTLRKRYIYAILIPGRATKSMLEEHIGALETVSEVRVDNHGFGDVEITVDTSLGILGDTTTISQEIYANLAGGVCSRGIFAAELTPEIVTPSIGDSSGGLLWVRPTVPVINSEMFSIYYTDHLGRSRTASVVVPSLTPRGAGIKATLESSTDRVCVVTGSDYAGEYNYDVLIGLGSWPYLYNLPEAISVSVSVRLRLTATPPSDLVAKLRASIEAYINDYAIGRSIEYSDIIISAIAKDYVNGGAFEGIEELISVYISAKGSTITEFGEKIVLDSDERADSAPANVEVVT